MATRRLFGGIDLGGTKIQTVVVNDGHEVLGEARHPTPTSGGPYCVPRLVTMPSPFWP